MGQSILGWQMRSWLEDGWKFTLFFHYSFIQTVWIGPYHFAQPWESRSQSNVTTQTPILVVEGQPTILCLHKLSSRIHKAYMENIKVWKEENNRPKRPDTQKLSTWDKESGIIVVGMERTSLSSASNVHFHVVRNFLYENQIWWRSYCERIPLLV